MGIPVAILPGVQADTAGATANELDVDTPAGAAIGDRIVLVAFNRSGSGFDFETPVEFSAFFNGGSSLYDNGCAAFYYDIRNASDLANLPGTVTVGLNNPIGAGDIALRCFRVTGVDLDATPTSGVYFTDPPPLATFEQLMPAISVPGPRSLAIAICAFESGAAVVTLGGSTDAAWSALVFDTSGGTVGDVQGFVSTADVAEAGSTPVFGWVSDTSNVGFGGALFAMQGAATVTDEAVSDVEGAWWLLDLEVDGRTYRYSHNRLVIRTDAGEEVIYRSGLADLVVALGAEQVPITLADEGVDWAGLGAFLEGGRAVLRRWVGGTTLDRALVFSSGEARGVAHGTNTEPVSFAITRDAPEFSLRGTKVPDALAKVFVDTWPVGSGELTQDEGRWYPIVFGTPGLIPSQSDPYCVVPCPYPQYNGAAGSDFLVIDHEAPTDAQTSVQIRVRNEALQAEDDEFVFVSQDGLRRRITTCFINTPTRPSSADEDIGFYVGFRAGGGPPDRQNAYDAVTYLLRKFGAGSVDWRQMEQVRGELALFKVDSWIDAPIDDPWVWVEALVEELPFEVRVSERGRYLERVRYLANGSRFVRSITQGVDAERVGVRVREAFGPFNEWEAVYRQDREGNYLGRVVITGSPQPSSPRIAAPPGVVTDPSAPTGDVSVIQDGRCARSRARWGLRPAPVVELPWTWTTATAVAALTWRIERDAIPQWRSSYQVRDALDLRVGDELRITDADLGLVDQPAVVMAPPTADRTDFALVQVMYEAE